MKSIVMKRAWEIKKEYDRKALSSVWNTEPRRESLREDEKAIFSECLKVAWSEIGRAKKITKEYNVNFEIAFKMATKETELTAESAGKISWKIWNNYGMIRAYYRCSNWSKYSNSKSYNFVA